MVEATAKDYFVRPLYQLARLLLVGSHVFALVVSVPLFLFRYARNFVISFTNMCVLGLKDQPLLRN